MKTIDTSIEISALSIHQLECEYFELRISQEHELIQFKSKQNKQKSELAKKLKKLNGVSRLRIHNVMTLYKRYQFKRSTERSNDVYTFIINDLERSFKRHYENNEKQIKEYISALFEMSDELVKFREQKKKKYTEFKRIVKRYDIDLSILDHAYNEFKITLKYIKSNELTLEEYNSRITKYSYLNEITDGFIVSEYKKSQILKSHIQKEKEIKKQNEQIYLDVIQSMFNTNKKKTDEYNAIYEIVNNLMNGESL